jgi:hypothetical protein
MSRLPLCAGCFAVSLQAMCLEKGTERLILTLLLPQCTMTPAAAAPPYGCGWPNKIVLMCWPGFCADMRGPLLWTVDLGVMSCGRFSHNGGSLDICSLQALRNPKWFLL